MMFHRKKNLFVTVLSVLTLVLFGINKTQAQVNAYTISSSITGYAPLSGATTTAFTAPWDNQTPVSVPIGFTFTFDTFNYTECYISPNGFITFGTTIPSTSNYLPLSDNTLYDVAGGGVVCALGTDLFSSASSPADIIYGIEGTAPNRTFVVQWTNANRKLAVGDFNFQIRLSETSNNIILSYGNCDTSLTPTEVKVQVGLRGQNNDITQGNVFNRYQGSSQLWGNPGATINGTFNTHASLTNTLAYPDFGFQYLYVPGPPCVTPPSQPTGLIIGGTAITSSSFVGNSFTAASPAPSKYLIVRSTVNIPPTSATFSDRTMYAVGFNYGTAPAPVYRVVGNSNLLSFNQTFLPAATTFYYWVISYNEKCSGGPFYNLVNPPSGSATTCFTTATANAASVVGGNEFTANWSAVANATGYALDVSTSSSFATFLPGYNNLILGSSVTTLPISGLLPFTTYYYRVRALGPGGCIINSNTITVTTTCGYYTIPYVQNFDTTPIGAAPTCFSVLNSNADVNQWKTQSVNFASASNSIQIDTNLSSDMDDWFFLPGLNLTAGVSYRLKFSYNTGNTASNSENLAVFYGTSQSVSGMINTLTILTGIDNSFYETTQIDFTPVSSGIFYIGFKGYSIANQTYIAVDDISVTLSPSCIEPTEVIASSVTATSLTLNWVPSTAPPALGYQYYLSTSATPPTLATVATGAVGAGITTLNLTGLNPSTSYWVWLRGNCSVSDKSVWSVEETFNTECSSPLVLSTVPVTRCGYGTATLVANPSVGSAIRWFDSLSGGSQVGSGTTFTTPAISSSATYYAEARAFGAIAKLGPSNPTTQMGVRGLQNYQGFVNFTVTSSTSLQSVDIFPIASGQAGKLVLRNSSNITIASFNFTTSVSGGSTLQQININYTFVPGTYNLFFDTLPTSGLRMNTTNAAYPYTSSVASIDGNSIDGNFNLGVYNWKFTTECLSPRVAVTATVTVPPALSLSATSFTICEGETTSPVTISGAGAYNSLVWSPSTGVSGSVASGFTFNPTVTTTYTLLANQTSGSFCGNKATLTVDVNQAPPIVSVLPVNPSFCAGTIQPLLGSTSIASPAILINENFNSPTNNWVVANTSTGGDTNASQWTLRPNGYTYGNQFGWNPTFISNDNSQFYLTNSDSQSGVAGTVTRTTLTSPSFSLAGFTMANLSFYHYINAIAFDAFEVQITSDNGASWTTMQSYSILQGGPSAFSNVVIDLVAYLGMPDLKIRFNYRSNWGYCWALDNVKVSGTLAAALTWLPITDLYSDPAATVPYVAGTPASVVYSKPTTNITYTATLTGSNGCTRVVTNSITVAPQTVAGVLSSDQSICTGVPANNLVLTGSFGSILRWEYANNAAFTSGVTTIANTTTTLTPAQMGVFSTIRYFRAVVKSGVCNQLYSNVVFVAFYSTTWNGTLWSNGPPNATTRAIFAGNYTSTGDLYACSVRVNSGVVTFNANHSLVVTNDVVVTGSGSLIFNNNASLVQLNNASVNSGNITYKRDTTPMRSFDYTYWSSPVANQVLSTFSPLTLSDKFFVFNPATAYWSNVPASSSMTPGVGYIVRAPTNFSPVVPAIYNGNFVGVPNNGIVTSPLLVSTSDNNLIGNPYPSAVSADLFLSDPLNVGVVDATIYFWTHNTPIAAGQYTSNDYAIYNYLGGTGTSSAPNNGVNNAVPNGKIAAGQSFFIKALTNGVATFSNAMRIVGNNDQFFRMQTPSSSESVSSEKHRIWLDVIDQQGNYKQTLVGYATNATMGIDRGYDGLFFNVGNPVALYSLVNTNDAMSIQGRALPFSDLDEVPLGFNAATSGSFTINLYDFDGLFDNQNIYLKDNLLNTIHDLKQSSYTFQSNSGTFNHRFVLVYRNQALSVPSVSFSASNVIVYKPNQELHVDAGVTLLKSVKVYDIRGRLLLEKKEINATNTSFEVGTTNQVLLLEITSMDGITITKKYVN